MNSNMDRRLGRNGTPLRGGPTASLVLHILLMISLTSAAAGATPPNSKLAPREPLRIKLSRKRPQMSIEETSRSNLAQCYRSAQSYPTPTPPPPPPPQIFNVSRASSAASDTNNRPTGACKIDLEQFVGHEPFTGPVSIGEPPQEMQVLFDTGSDVLWVAHRKCRFNDRYLASRDRQQAGRFAFAPSQSQTLSMDDGIGRAQAARQVRLKYLNSLEFAGVWARDSVSLGTRGAEQRLVVPHQWLAVILRIRGPAESQYEPHFDGIVGLSFPTHHHANQSTLMESLILNGHLQELVFSFYMPQLEEGELILGAIDHSKYRGSIAWAPVVREPHWEIRLSRVGSSEGFTETGQLRDEYSVCHYGCQAVVDTGTTLIVGHPQQVDSLNKLLGFVRKTDQDGEPDGPATYWSPDCGQRNFERNIRLVVELSSGQQLSIGPESYIVRAGPYCMSALYSLSSDVGLQESWLLGAVFLAEHYTVFDYGQKRVGFAQPRRT